VLEADHRARLKALLDSLRDNTTAYVVRCACDPDPMDRWNTVVDHIRLFPLRPEVRWTYRVHEQILPALRLPGLHPLERVVVRHTGYVEKGIWKRKLATQRKILTEELAERPNDPFVLFNLGCIAWSTKRPSGIALLSAQLGRSRRRTRSRASYALIARSHQLLGEPEAALAGLR